MRLYSGLSPDFIRDTTHNRIAEKLKDAFFREFRYNPPPSEVNPWRNSLRAVSQVIDEAELHDHGILFEYQLPRALHGQRHRALCEWQDGGWEAGEGMGGGGDVRP
jgi:hypothetical protein